MRCSTLLVRNAINHIFFKGATMKKMRKHRNYPALFVPVQRENENYESPEKSTHSKKTESKHGYKKPKRYLWKD